jgi:hypothetical protein
VAYLCHACHQRIDTGRESQEEKVELWEQAHRRTIAYLFLEGIIK